MCSTLEGLGQCPARAADSMGADGPNRRTQRPFFSELEKKAVYDGVDGIKGMLPGRCYHDEDVWKWEVENVLKKNWFCVGRWDWAEKPGDYFTTSQFGEPVVIIRDRENTLHALINVCQHRWSQVLPDGSGNVKLMVCPYHSWTYNLDGTMRGITIKNMIEVDKKTRSMPKLRLEVWQGLIFINFDPDAAPLAPQLEGALAFMGRHGMGEFRSAGKITYDTTWNYKFSFETGYEAYHHEGIHKNWAGGTAIFHEAKAFGKIWGIYTGQYPPGDPHGVFPFGPPPWKTPEEVSDGDTHVFLGIYPNLIMFISSEQQTMITTEFMGVTNSRSTTSTAIAPWALAHPDAEAKTAETVQMMVDTQAEDSWGCRLIQAGVRSSYNHNHRSIVHHPLETQLSHYYAWWMDQYQNA